MKVIFKFGTLFNSALFDTFLSTRPISRQHCYRLLKKAAKKLMKTDITIEKVELNETWYINICSIAKYNNSEGSINVEFTHHIMPYLTQVKERFLLYNLKEIANFQSLYSTRLFELIKEFKVTGWMKKSVKQLRESFAVGSKFKKYYDLKKRTFLPACKEINTLYKDLNLKFKEIKEGRKIVAIKFSFKKIEVKEIIDRLGNTHTIHEKFKLPDQKFIRENNIFKEKQDSIKKVEKIEHPLSSFDKLKEYGLSKQEIKKIIQDNSEEVIQKAIKSVNIQVLKGNVRNPKAMLLTAINEKWEIGKYIPRK